MSLSSLDDQDFDPSDIDEGVFVEPEPLSWSGGNEDDLIDRTCLQNSLVLSQAAYEDDPKSFLEDSRCQSHNFKSVFVSKNLKCRFLLAEVRDNRTIYVAFRGTSNCDDILTDLDIKLETAENYPWFGLFHRGFLEMAELMPLMKIINSELVGHKELVFCGHSMGGAVSSIAALYAAAIEKEQNPSFIRKIRNMTFGSPLFGNKQLAKWIKSSRLSVTMQHFVSSGDPVPSLLNLTQTALYLKNKVGDKSLAFLMQVVAFILKLGSKAQPSDTKEVLKQSFEQIKTVLENENPATEQLYCPIGNFSVLDELSGTRNLSSVFVSFCENPQDRLLDISKFQNDSWKSLKEHHSILNYMKLFKKASYVEVQASIRSSELQEITVFQPTVEKGKLIVRKESAELELFGENIGEICLDTSRFEFGFPFGDEKATKNLVKYNEKNCIKDRVRIQQPIEGQKPVITFDGCKINVQTVFGSCDFFLLKCNIDDKALTLDVPFGKTDETSLMLIVAIRRAKAFAKIRKTEIQEEPLFKLVLDLGFSCLPVLRFRAWRQDLFKADDEKLRNTQFFEPIEKALKKPITLHAEKTREQNRNIKGLALLSSVTGCASLYWAKSSRQYIDCESWNDCLIYCMSAGAVGMTVSMFLDILTRKQISDKDYYIALQFVASELMAVNSDKEEIQSLLLDNSIYSIEKAICLMDKNNTQLKKGTIAEKSERELKNRIALIRKTHEIRDLMCSQGVIGLVGPQNSGKTMFMNFLTGSKFPEGNLVHTETLQLKNMSQHIAVADFPGSNSLNQCAETFNQCGSISSVIVLIVQFSGDVDKNLSEEIAKVYKSAMVSGHSKILICLNKSWCHLDSLEKELQGHADPADYLKGEYIAKLNKHFEDTSQRITISKDDIFFTDWKPNNALNTFRIYGRKDIKEQIMLRLRQLGIKIK